MKKHPVRTLLVNAALVALAFGLLGLVIWQAPRARSAKVLQPQPRSAASSHRPSRSIYTSRVRADATSAGTWLVRVIEPGVPAPRTRRHARATSATSSTS